MDRLSNHEVIETLPGFAEAAMSRFTAWGMKKVARTIRQLCRENKSIFRLRPQGDSESCMVMLSLRPQSLVPMDWGKSTKVAMVYCVYFARPGSFGSPAMEGYIASTDTEWLTGKLALLGRDGFKIIYTSWQR